jgi:cytochrome c oxidase subunit 4
MTTDNDTISVRIYVIIFGALLLLTALTVGAAFIDLGGLNNIVALLIAAAKAALVVTYFMHVRHSTGLVKASIAAGGIWLAILIGLTVSDYVSRPW